MDSTQSDFSDAGAEQVSRLLDEGRLAFRLSWVTGHPGNPSGSERILEYEGRYYVLPDDEVNPAGVFDDFETAFSSPEAERFRTLTASTTEIECERWSVDDLLERMSLDQWVAEELIPGKLILVNGRAFAWNWGNELSDPEDVAPLSPSEAAEGIFSTASPRVACEGSPRIFENANWFWIEAAEEEQVEARGYRSLADARAARGEPIELLTLVWRGRNIVEETEFEEALWFRWSKRTGELWSGAPGAGQLSGSRVFRCSAMNAAVALLDQHLHTLLCSPWSPGAPSCIRGAALSRDLGRRRIVSVKAKIRRTSAKAAKKTASILDVAREAGLHPEPSGDSEHHWVARCPKHHLHPLLISTAGDGSFGCGYCKRKGDARALERWTRTLGRHRAP